MLNSLKDGEPRQREDFPDRQKAFQTQDGLVTTGREPQAPDQQMQQQWQAAADKAPQDVLRIKNWLRLWH